MQPDRPGAVDDRLVTRLDVGHLGGVVAGREDVGQHHVVGLPLLGVLAQAQAVEVSPGHPQQLRLTAGPGAHVGEAVSCPGPLLPRLRGQAVVGEAALAVLAVPAGHVERQDDVLADRHLVDAVADLDDLAHVLVPKPAGPSRSPSALVHVQVRAADVRRGDPHQDASVGRSISASGTSLTRTSRGPWYTTAFMVTSLQTLFRRS